MSGPFGSSQWMYNAGGAFYPYSIDQSLRFNDNDSANLNRTPSTAGDRQVWTWSAWLKRSTLSTTQYLFVGGSNADNATYVRFFSNDKFQIFHYDSNSTTNNVQTEQVFRDVSSWYHIVLAVDTTQATSSDRVKIYVNGERVTNFTTATYPSLNFNYDINTTGSHRIGSNYSGSGTFFDGYMAEVHFVDGTQYAASDFGETINGIWVPKEVSGLTYGTNGFYLSFADSNAIGDDLSGNTNDWTANNLAASDVMTDSPTNNFATWSATGVQYGGTNAPTVSEGSLKAATSGNPTHIYSTFAIQPSDTQGYYWEVKAISLDTARSYLGIVAPEGGASGAAIGSYQFYYKFVLNMNGSLYANNDVSATNVVALTSWTTNDILMFAYKEGKIWIGKNGTWMNSGDPAAGTGDLVAQDGGRPSDRGDVTWYPYAGFNSTYTANFGQEGTFAGTETAGGNADENGYGDFKYAVPSGFLALCSANLAEVTIGPNSTTTSDQHFNTVLYTGNGTSASSTQAITGVGFQPDWLWTKSRSLTSGGAIWDVIRGDDGFLVSHVPNAENTTDDYLSSFDTDGFTVKGNGGNANASGATYVAWNWKAGGTASTIAVDAYSAGVPSIASSVSANQDAGFSIVSYTGVTGDDTVRTIGHGLNSAPELIIVKNRDWASGGDGGWEVGLPFLSTPEGILLDATAASSTTQWDRFFNTAPTDDVFSTYSASAFATTVRYRTNGRADNYIAYCFHSVDGFSKVGKYIANNNANGPFIYTGFKPAWVMIKNTANGATNWLILDTDRSTFNVMNNFLYPNTTGAESASTVLKVDFLSNGFKIRNATYGETNAAAGNTFIYLAFAEAPFKYANAR